MQLFWMYKDFLWGTFEIVGRRVWDQSANRAGVGKALPWLIAGLAIAPMAAAGYELRKMATGQVDPQDDEAGHYAWKLLDRSGMLGPFSLLWSMESEAERGHFALAALGGPFASKLSNLMEEDGVMNTVATTTPIASVFPAYKRAVRGF